MFPVPVLGCIAILANGNAYTRVQYLHGLRRAHARVCIVARLLAHQAYQVRRLQPRRVGPRGEPAEKRKRARAK
jgi:hypothetical protein